MNREIGYDYDDIYLIPNYSPIKSRKNNTNNTKVTIGDIVLDLPIISANMATVTGFRMATELQIFGATGIIHRFYKHPGDFIEDYKNYGLNHYSYDISVGAITKNDIVIRALTDKKFEDVKPIIRSITIDIAHGHSKVMVDGIKKIRKLFPDTTLIVGNICTPEAVDDLIKYCGLNFDAVKVGMGPGSVCTTRLMTGFGTPQFTAVLNVRKKLDEIKEKTGKKIYLIADGGIKYVADIVKAYVAGADAVMIGSMFAGYEETPTPLFYEGNFPNQKFYKQYRGSASYESKLYSGQKPNHSEGISIKVDYKGSVKNAVDEIRDGILSAMSYAGINDIKDFRKVKWGIKY